MDPLVISEIFAKPEIPISRNLPDETTLIPGAEAQVWDWTKPGDSSDPTAWDGSLTPFGFLLDPKNKGVAHIRITGNVTYPQEWQGVLEPVLVGYLDDITKAPLLSAKIGEVVLPPRNAPAGPLSFDVAQMDFAEPLDPILALQSPVPYKVAGDFKWMLTCPDTPFAPITTTVTSRLESYRLKAYASSGPLKVESWHSETHLDMQGKYPVSVLRLFVPSLSELKEAGSDLITGVKYNAIDGRSGYGVGCCGGSFNWKDWVARVNPYVNSFDLPALLQIAMSLFSTRNFYEYDVTLRWVCHTPDGFLQTSIPFGWDGSVHPDMSAGVTNPFFLGLTRNYAIRLPDPSKVPNCGLNARVWLEIGPSDDIGGQFVVDTAFNVMGKGQMSYQLELARLTRDAFLKAHLSKSEGGSLNALDNGVPDLMAACFSNESFGGLQSGEPGTITRVGVVNLLGANGPKFGPRPVPLMPIPPSMRNAISAAVKAREVAGALWAYNDASLKSSDIFPVLVKTTPFTVGGSWVNVAKGVSVVTYLLGNVGINDYTTGQICVKIHVYDNFHGSTEALVFELSKVESKPDAVLNRKVNSTVGNYYVTTNSSVLFVRGNLLVDISFIGTSSVDNAYYAAGVLMASRLDAYLSANQVVVETQVRRPSLALATPTADEVNGEIVVGNSFDVTMADPELLAGECLVAGSNLGRVLLCTSGPVAGQADKKFGFLAMSLDMPRVGQKTEVTIVGAHPETYHPGFSSFAVTVKPK
ncbi:hypothetical protein GE09DRAFT_1211990 [Coniochaeta sp. 2T2.1]|nr:hypothetical protein GE09DRAFT_1211990 [Coniochaeta sp. 2T2.1]